ncbi:hypothetical protein CS542_06410 [Pedobacter sp. IW39]|nr:hypothetical protein CS542_06410 [Pedobacter sp. IW39]
MSDRLETGQSIVEINGADGLLKQNICQTDELILHHNQNTITLNFALLNYVKPENKYSYKLEGFEKNWNAVNTPTATYTNHHPAIMFFR